MNSSTLLGFIGIPSAILAVITLIGMAQENPHANSEIAVPLWLLALALLGSFGLGILAYRLSQRKSGGGVWIVPAGLTPLGRELREKYGEGFTDEDELIIESAKKGYDSVNEIATFTNLSKKLIKERIKFMEEKGMDDVEFY